MGGSTTNNPSVSDSMGAGNKTKPGDPHGLT